VNVEDDLPAAVEVDLQLGTACPVDAGSDDVTTGRDWDYQPLADADLADGLSVDVNPVRAPPVSPVEVPTTFGSLNHDAGELRCLAHGARTNRPMRRR
jgi:hypothetical protein